MNFLLRLLPFPVGLGVAYLVGKNVSGLDKSVKLIIISICVVCLGYLSTWFNIKMMKKKGLYPKNKLFKQKMPGYILLILGAQIMGYGFSINNQVLLLIGFLFLWVSDDSLTKQN